MSSSLSQLEDKTHVSSARGFAKSSWIFASGAAAEAIVTMCCVGDVVWFGCG